MNFRLLIFCFFIPLFCSAQQQNKTLVFKVRAQPTECSIICKDKLLLELNNPIQVKVTGRNKDIKVVISGGQIISRQGDIYYVRFLRPGASVISVYLNTPKGRKLIATQQLPVKNPVVYFCGIEIDSSSKYLNLKGTQFYAYSEHFKKKMPVVSFEMYYVDDTLVKNIQPIILKSDTCMLSAEMKKRVLSFQPNHNYMYFYNIVCQVPDGSKRILDPIEFHIQEPAEGRVYNQLTLVYSLKRRKQ
jgi:hypothetical protein